MRTSPRPGVPATYIGAIVVNKRREMMRGFVSITISRASVLRATRAVAVVTLELMPAPARVSSPFSIRQARRFARVRRTRTPKPREERPSPDAAIATPSADASRPSQLQSILVTRRDQTRHAPIEPEHVAHFSSAAQRRY